MEKDTKRDQNCIIPKTSTISSPKINIKSDSGGIGSTPKKEESVDLSEIVVTDKRDKISETKSKSTEHEKNNNDLSESKKKHNQNHEVKPDSTILKKKPVKIPVLENNKKQEPSNVAVPRVQPPLPPPSLGIRPLVMSIHLVPSLPISLFEILAEAIEAATSKPVVLLYESRVDRPVAKEVSDIAILPAGNKWTDGLLLPASFVFEHHLNKDFMPHVYGDVVVATDRAPHVETLLDLRGHRCAIPNRRIPIGAARLLFNYLYSKGEGPSFFGNTLDANSQVAALQMIAGKQVEVGILESPVLKYQRNYLPGVESLHILTSLGPLPPYQIMVHKDMPGSLSNKIASYLLNLKGNSDWMEKFSPYSVLGFAKNCNSYYDLNEIKSVVTDVPYY